MTTQEFVVKTLEIDRLAPMFGGVHLTGEFFLNESVRIVGEAVLSTKGNLSPQPDTTTASFHGGTSPQLNVQFAHDRDPSIFRSVIPNAWTGCTIFFDETELDPHSPKEVSVASEKVKFRRTF